jgi:cytochrome o ubiquinol oxidase operon protein cyoD
MSSEAVNASGRHERVPFGHDTPGGLHVTLRGYLTGFGLAAILTAIPFWLVMGNVIPDHFVAALGVMAFAAVQIIVHMVFFLHMGPKVEGGWSLMALIFTLIILAIALVGSLWVMYHLNANMMPMTAQEARQLP